MKTGMSEFIRSAEKWLKNVAAFGFCVILTSCGPGASDPQQGSQTRIAAAVMTVPTPSVTVTGVTKISETRISRSVYDYVFRLTVKNNSAQVQNGINAKLLSAGNGTTIIDGAVQVGSMNAGSTVTTTDTITLRQDRTLPFSFNALVWEITANSTSTTPGILLPGTATDLATTALKDYAAVLSTVDLETEIVPDSDALYYKTQLKAVIKPSATIGQVNNALLAIGGRIVAIWDGDPVLTVQIPDPGSLASLKNVAAALERSDAFDVVAPVYVPQPDVLPSNVTSAEAVNSTGPIYHQLAARLAPAWNAMKIDTSASKVEVVIIDYFGNGGVTEINATVPVNGITTGNKCVKVDRVTKIRTSFICTHGYLVLGILDGSFGGTDTPVGKVTGALPKNIKVNVIDLAGLNGAEPLNYIKERLRAIVKASPMSRFVINMSIGYCTSLTECKSLQASQRDGYIWRKMVRNLAPGFNYDSQVIQVSSAGNDGDKALAYQNSPWNAAVLLGKLWSEPQLTNGLVVENRTVSNVNGVLSPGPRAASSTVGGNVGAIGSTVYSLAGPSNTLYPSGTLYYADGGTSSATPQVAGLAAYMQLIGETKPIKPSVQDIVNKIIHGRKDPDIPSAPPIDAYASLLSLDTSMGDATVRLALLQPVTNTVPSAQFDLAKAKRFLQAFFPTAYGPLVEPPQPDFSEFDLNGDGYTGDPLRTAPFKLDPAKNTYDELTKYPNTLPVKVDEKNLTDFEILCYYVNSELFRKEDIPQFNVELQFISTKLGRTISCSNFSVLLNVNTTNPNWTGLPAKISLSSFVATNKFLFSISGDPGNTCGTGERGGPIFSSFVPLTASFYSAAIITGLPINNGGPGINRRPCSSFYAFEPSGQIWINATGRGQQFGGAVQDWEIQVRYSNGDANGAGRMCEVGVVPNSGNFAKNFDAVCTHEVAYKVTQ